jgi:ADP-ribose pyrophosphatase YjhB (NUDIX family)
MCALILNESKEVLLTKRARDPYKGYWDVPGGFLHNGEDVAVGLKREMREELGIEIEIGEYITAITDVYGDLGYYTLNFFYLCTIMSGELRPADDVVEYCYFPLSELPDKIAFENSRQGLAVLRHWLSS